MHAFWLVLIYDLLEDRRIIKTFLILYYITYVIIKTFFNPLLYKTNRFQVAVRLFSKRSQRTSKCGKNISDTLGCASCATFLFLPYFDIIRDLFLNIRTARAYLFQITLEIMWLPIQTKYLITKQFYQCYFMT